MPRLSRIFSFLASTRAGVFTPPGVGSGRSRPGAQKARAFAAWLARIAAIFALLGLALQLAGGDRWQLTAPFAFALPPLISAAGLLAAASLWGAAGWRRAAWIALFGAALTGAIGVGRDYRPGSCRSSAQAMRLVSWNVRHQLDDETATALRRLAADVVILVEADGVPPRRWEAALPGYAVCAPAGGVMVLARRPILECERRRLGERSHAVLAHVGGDRPNRFIGVDIDGHPLSSRREPIEAIVEIVRDGWEQAVVGGDFNTPRRARAFESLRRSHAHAFDEAGDGEAGDGWAGSWPAALPVLDIDHVWLPRQMPARTPACVRFGASAGSDHRLLIVDLEPSDGGGGRGAHPPTAVR